MIEDTTGQNDGSLCPPVNNYDWGQEGHGLYGEPPEGDQLTAWWTAQKVTCGAPGSSTLFIQNFRFYGLKTSGWVSMGGDWDDWCASTNPDTTSGYGSCSFSGGGVVMPAGQRALHGATSRVPDQNILCAVVLYEVRHTGTPLLANVGMDHIAGGSILGDQFISRYKQTTTTFQTRGGSSCTRTQLYNNIPPGVAAEN